MKPKLIMDYIQNATWIEDTQDINPDDGLINVKNGLLDWRTGNLKPHDLKRLSTVQIPVEYNPSATCPKINAYMNSTLPTDSLTLAAELFGYCLIPSTRFQKAFMLTGTGANGKSVFIDLLTAFIGETNTSNVPLQDLESNRFKLAQLYGRLLNTFADLPHKALDSSSVFKSIVSGDRMSGEFKGRDSFDFRPFARLVFSANEIPISRDLTDGFFRRWIIIPFPNKFEHGGNAIDNLIEQLTTPEELSGLLNVALDGLRRLHQQRKFTENESTRTAVERYRMESDNVAMFIDEACILGGECCVDKTSLFKTYEHWCDESGLRSLGKIRFNERLTQLIPSIQEHRELGKPRQWKGIGLTIPEFVS